MRKIEPSQTLKILRDLTDRLVDRDTEIKYDLHLFSVFMNNIPAVCFIKDINGFYKYVNNTFSYSIGYTLEELENKTDFDLYSESEAVVIKNNDAMVLKNNEPVHTIETVTDVSGSLRYWLVVKFPLYDNKGTKYIGGAALDVTDRIELLNQLEKQSQFFEQVIDLNPSFIYAKDIEGKFILINKAVCDVYGVDEKKDILGKTDADFSPNEEEVKWFREIDLKVINEKKKIEVSIEPVTSANNEKLFCKTIKTPIIEENGFCNKVLGVSTDITDIVNLKEKYTIIFNGITESIFICDIDTKKILESNDRAVEMFGYSKEEFVGSEIYKVFFDSTKETIDSIFDSRVNSTIPVDLFFKNTEDRKFQGVLFIKTIAFNDSDYFMVSIRDIEHRRINQLNVEALNHVYRENLEEIETILKSGKPPEELLGCIKSLILDKDLVKGINEYINSRL